MKKLLTIDVEFSIVALGVFVVALASSFLMGLHANVPFPIHIVSRLLLFLMFPVSICLSLWAAVWPKRTQRSRQVSAALLAVTVVCAGLSFVRSLSPFDFAWDLGNRCYVSQFMDLDELQKWSLTAREIDPSTPLNDFSTGRFEEFAHLVPEQVQRMVEKHGTIRSSWRAGNEKCVAIWFGGGFWHWGVFVGSPTFVPHKRPDQKVFKWQSGIYGFQGP